MLMKKYYGSNVDNKTTGVVFVLPILIIPYI
jgi:hypothetical protein